MANDLAEKLAPNIGDHLVAHPIHVVRISVRAEAAHSHDGRNGEADKNDRIDFWAGVQNFQIRAQGHWVRSGSVEDSACYPGNDEREKRIDHAEGHAQRQAKYKTRLIRLDVTIDPPVRTRCCFKNLPKEGSLLCGFTVLHQICVVADKSRAFIAQITSPC